MLQEFAPYLVAKQGIQHLVQLSPLLLSLLTVDHGHASGTGEHMFLITGTHASVHHATDPLLLGLSCVLNERLTTILVCNY